MTKKNKNILDDISTGSTNEQFLRISVEYHPNYKEAKHKNLIGNLDSIFSCSLVSEEELKMSMVIDIVNAIAREANIPITLK